MRTIFLDECGYTGEDLLNIDQPLFVLASHDIEEELCKDLKWHFFGRVESKELKHSSLSKRPSQQKMVLNFLKYLKEENYNVKVSSIHKKYALICKMIDLIEDAAYDDGIDLYEQGCNIAMANLFFYTLPVFGGIDFANELLKRFQNLMRNKTKKSYDEFFIPLMNLDESKVAHKDKLEDILTFLKYLHFKYGYSLLDSLAKNNYLDIALSSSLFLMSRWRKIINDKIVVIHDKSKNMSKQKDIWDAIMDPELDECIIGYDRRTMKFPIAVSATRFESSLEWDGLQIADVISGATATSLMGLIKEESEDDYSEKLCELTKSFIEHVIWPEATVLPSELGTIGANYRNPIDYMREVISKSKKDNK